MERRKGNGMKDSNVLFIVLIMAAMAIIWFVRGYVDELEYEKRIAELKPTSTTTVTEKETPRPPETKEVTQPAKPPTNEHKVNSDSIFNAGMAAGIESLRETFAQYTAPRDTTVVFATGDTLIHQSHPLRRMDIYTLKPAPRKETFTHRIDSIPYPVPVEGKTSLMEDAACASIGAGAGVLLAGPIGAVVGAPVAVIVYRWIK
ncbi:MAG: hypothetical protein ACYC09_13045 [Bacteroidota bacterium]